MIKRFLSESVQGLRLAWKDLLRLTSSKKEAPKLDEVTETGDGGEQLLGITSNMVLEAVKVNDKTSLLALRDKLERMDPKAELTEAQVKLKKRLQQGLNVYRSVVAKPTPDQDLAMPAQRAISQVTEIVLHKVYGDRVVEAQIDKNLPIFFLYSNAGDVAARAGMFTMYKNYHDGYPGKGSGDAMDTMLDNLGFQGQIFNLAISSLENKTD